MKRYRVNERFYWIVTILILAITMTWLITDYNSYQASHKEPIPDRSVTTVEEFQDKAEQNVPPGPQPISLGTFTITHYTNSLECCGKTDGITSTGVKAQPNRTIAVDPGVIPYGTEVIIDGKIYVAEDKGGAIDGKRLDIYVGSMNEAITRGVIEREVFLIK